MHGTRCIISHTFNDVMKKSLFVVLAQVFCQQEMNIKASAVCKFAKIAFGRHCT
jgi:hypothetical protein